MTLASRGPPGYTKGPALPLAPRDSALWRVGGGALVKILTVSALCKAQGHRPAGETDQNPSDALVREGLFERDV